MSLHVDSHTDWRRYRENVMRGKNNTKYIVIHVFIMPTEKWVKFWCDLSRVGKA